MIVLKPLQLEETSSNELGTRIWIGDARARVLVYF